MNSRPQRRRISEDLQRTIWIYEVKQKLRHALACAAEGKDFDWYDVQIGPDLNPDPTAYLWPPDLAQAWPEPLRPGFPELPGPDTTFEELKRYANVAMWADDLLQCDEDFDMPADLRLTETGAWALAEQLYDGLHPEGQAGETAAT